MSRPALRVPARDRAAIGPRYLPHEATGDVRVVGDRDGVAAVRAPQAVTIDRRPESLGRGRVDVVGRTGGDAIVAEDHVAMDVPPARHAGPLVAHEAGEAAGGASVVGLLGGQDGPAPRIVRGLPTEIAVLAAEAVARRLLHAEDTAVHERVAEPRPAAHDGADIGVVAGAAGCVAHPGFAHHLGVVGHHGEVEGAAQLDRLAGGAVLRVGLDAEGLAPREAIGVPRRVARALAHGVEGEGGVHVRIPVEGAPQRLVTGAGLARLAGLEGSYRLGAGESGHQ
jgi:hypothetical protein